MKRRSWKTIALFASGGLMLQVGGCGAILLELLFQNFLTAMLTSLATVLTGTGATTLP